MESRTEVLVIGGGSTGTGVARDLATRGLDVTLVDRGKLAHGTTGRMHGLLHSGGRYAVEDPTSARECVRENRILREIAGHCVAETGGLFVEHPEDPGGYFERKLDACRDCDIPATVLSGEAAREREPSLADDVERAIAVPDGTVDPFRLCVATAASAERRGARIETHAAVVDLLVEDGRIVGAAVEHGTDPEKYGSGSPGECERIRADHVVNAAGAWAGRVAEAAGVDVEMRPSKGVMTVVDFGGVDTVLNRCRPKDSGDIVVPGEATCILGTTDETVDDPDDYDEEQWEVDLVRDELSALVPALASAPTVRSFWGVRPLYDPSGSDAADPTDATRGFAVLDHAERDGRPGLTTVVGGKLTTYRLMAERTADLVCERLGVDADCETASVPLPGREDRSVLRGYMADFGLELPDGRRSVGGHPFPG